MSTTYAIPMTGLIPREFSFEDTARIMINDEMLNIIVLMYSESHVDNVEVSNMLSDSVSMYAYGAMPISIALSGLVKEAKDGNHLYSVLKKYKTEWRQRLLTDYKKNTKLTIMDVVMDFAITSINIVKNTDIMGYDTINIDGIGWNYTMPQDSLFKYSGDGLDGEEAATATTITGDTNTTNTNTTSTTANAQTSSGSSTENSTEATQSAQDLNTQTEKEEKKNEDQMPTKVMYKKEEPVTAKEDASGEVATTAENKEGATAKIESTSTEEDYTMKSEQMNVHTESYNGVPLDTTATVTRTYVYKGKTVTTTKACTSLDLLSKGEMEVAVAKADSESEKQSIRQEYFNDWKYRKTRGLSDYEQPATYDDIKSYQALHAEARSITRKKENQKKKAAGIDVDERVQAFYEQMDREDGYNPDDEDEDTQVDPGTLPKDQMDLDNM